MIVYLPEDRNGTPPAVNDPAWKLGDGGSWKSGNKYPVYAVPGSAGTIIMHQLSLYSGNATNVTNGDILAADHNSGQYIRLYTSITLSSQSSLPSLWAFLLIVLGIVLFLIGATSVSMHCIQRRNRQNLRRRVADGDVDLEALGIKRLTVPREALDKMPLFIYSASEDQQTDKYSTKSASRTETVLPEGHFSPDIPSKPLRTCKPSYMITQPSSKAAKTEPKSEAPSFPLSLPHRQLSFSQPTCPICLDDFESHHTAVRELPCQHVFHPGCIDVFLTENSSLCPVCKAKVLPKGYCPEIITNAMVRHERQTRRRQQQRNLAAMSARRTSQGVHNREMSIGRRITSLHEHFGRTGTSETGDRRFSSAPNRLDATDLDLGNRSSTNPSANTQIITRPAVDRREWVRRRASALLRHHRTADDEDREGWASLPRCKFLNSLDPISLFM